MDWKKCVLTSGYMMFSNLENNQSLLATQRHDISTAFSFCLGFMQILSSVKIICLDLNICMPEQGSGQEQGQLHHLFIEPYSGY
jgi:hypothetical protein